MDNSPEKGKPWERASFPDNYVYLGHNATFPNDYSARVIRSITPVPWHRVPLTPVKIAEQATLHFRRHWLIYFMIFETYFHSRRRLAKMQPDIYQVV
jgi:hypothetical protein